MTTEQLLILGNAVVEGTTVSGKFQNNNYKVCDLMELSLESLDSIYSSLSEIANKQATGSLLKRNTVSLSIKKQLELVETVFMIKKEIVEETRRRQKEKQENLQRLSVLKNLKTQKELEELGKLTSEEIEVQIAELEK